MDQVYPRDIYSIQHGYRDASLSNSPPPYEATVPSAPPYAPPKSSSLPGAKKTSASRQTVKTSSSPFSFFTQNKLRLVLFLVFVTILLLILLAGVVIMLLFAIGETNF